VLEEKDHDDDASVTESDPGTPSRSVVDDLAGMIETMSLSDADEVENEVENDDASKDDDDANESSRLVSSLKRVETGTVVEGKQAKAF
jgi:hypothetical protein